MQQQFNDDYYQQPDEDLPDISDVLKERGEEFDDVAAEEELEVDEYLDASASYEKQKKLKKRGGAAETSQVKLPETVAKTLEMDLLKEKQEVSMLLEKLQSLDYEDIVAGIKILHLQLTLSSLH